MGETVLHFAQVVAMDQKFDLLKRAWCVAELVEAKRSTMPQSLKCFDEESLEAQSAELEKLDVRHCEASREQDKDAILSKIDDIDAFNAELAGLLFDGDNGLLSAWKREAATNCV